ncbi:hypothetical protein [Streptosporangium amethystogenes]|uniref:hypothetical protein n=1 Tax=Streptosporangium amethystogenes TaxID=2002 RepID=UPI0031D884B8
MFGFRDLDAYGCHTDARRQGAREIPVNDGPPPELLNSDPKGYAWQVWHDRTPKLVAKIKDVNSYGPKECDALDALLAEIFSGVMEPLGAHAHDREVWAGWGADHQARARTGHYRRQAVHET